MPSCPGNLLGQHQHLLTAPDSEEHFSAQSQRGSWVHAEGVGCLLLEICCLLLSHPGKLMADVEVSTDVPWCSPCLCFIGQPLQPTWGDPGLP